MILTLYIPLVLVDCVFQFRNIRLQISYPEIIPAENVLINVIGCVRQFLISVRVYVLQKSGIRRLLPEQHPQTIAEWEGKRVRISFSQLFPEDVGSHFPPKQFIIADIMKKDNAVLFNLSRPGFKIMLYVLIIV